MKRVSLLSLIICPGLVAALASASCAPPDREAPVPPDVKEIRAIGCAAPCVVHAAVWLCARGLTDVTAWGSRLSGGRAPAVRAVCENK